MKKLICAIITIGVIFSYAMTAFAGDIPESLLGSDKALVFFGEAVSYNADKSITVMPTQKVKGDVEIGKELSYNEVITLGKFSIKKGETYLFGYYDENNPLTAFHTTSIDARTLKILDKSGGGQEERMQTYLNDGAFERAEVERLSKINAQIPAAATTSAPQNISNNQIYVVCSVVICAAVFIVLYYILIFRKRKCR